MKRADNTPQRSLQSIPAEKVQIIVTDLLQLHELGKCEDDAAVEERISQYFQLCRETSIRPGIESLSAALHVDRTTIWRWARGEGCSKRRSEAIASAKAMIASFVEQAMMSGQINPVTGIFLSKNWLGYSDTYVLEQGQQTAQLTPSRTPEEIAAEIERDIPLDIGYDENEREVLT